MLVSKETEEFKLGNDMKNKSVLYILFLVVMLISVNLHAKVPHAYLRFVQWDSNNFKPSLSKMSGSIVGDTLSICVPKNIPSRGYTIALKLKYSGRTKNKGAFTMVVSNQSQYLEQLPPIIRDWGGGNKDIKYKITMKANKVAALMKKGNERKYYSYIDIIFKAKGSNPKKITINLLNYSPYYGQVNTSCVRRYGNPKR